MDLDIHLLLEKKYQGRNYECHGRWPDMKIVFKDEGPVPTKKELKEKWKELLEEQDDPYYADKRLFEYPSIQELVVALWDKEVSGDKAKVLDLEAKRQKIKKKYPKKKKR